MSAWDGSRVFVDEYRELDERRVLVLTRGRGKASELEPERLGTSRAAIFHVGASKVTRHVMCRERDRGLADLGLAPETASQDSWPPSPLVGMLQLASASRTYITSSGSLC
jgi:hypothetical protein